MHEGHHDILGGHEHKDGQAPGQGRGSVKKTNGAQIVSIAIVAALVTVFVLWRLL